MFDVVQTSNSFVSRPRRADLGDALCALGCGVARIGRPSSALGYDAFEVERCATTACRCACALAADLNGAQSWQSQEWAGKQQRLVFSGDEGGFAHALIERLARAARSRSEVGADVERSNGSLELKRDPAASRAAAQAAVVALDLT